MRFHTFMLIFLASFGNNAEGNQNEEAPVPEHEHIYGNYSFIPHEEELGNVWEDQVKFVLVNFPFCTKNYTTYTASINDVVIASIANTTLLTPGQNIDSGCHALKVGVRGERLGKAYINVTVVYENEDESDPCSKEITKTDSYGVVVMRPPKMEGKIFRLGVAVFLVILNFGFGCSLNLDIVKEILKKPIAPAVGFCCQYIMMPLIGTLVSKTLLSGDPLYGFGLLCSSCSPGGAGSNVWCLLLGGDVNLSLTMTFFSLTASMFMMPFWLFVLGRLFIDPSKVSVPYLNILMQLATFVIPCFFGVLIRKWRQNIGERLGRMIKPLSLIFLAWLLTFGLYVNRYIYGLMAATPRIVPPAIIQPYLGFACGFLIGRFIAKQPKYRAITIAIETGVQNVTIPMVMLQGSFAQPFGDLAATMPVMTAHFTPLPLLFVFLGLTVYNKFFKERCGNGESKDEDEEKKIPDDVKNDVIDKEVQLRAEQKAKALGNGYRDLYPAHQYERDSLLIQNGLTGSALGRKFFMEDKESVI